MPDSLTRAVRWDTVVGALLVVLLLLSFGTVDGFGNSYSSADSLRPILDKLGHCSDRARHHRHR